MKTILQTKVLYTFILLCVVSFTGCSSDLEQNSQKQDAVNIQETEIKTSFSQDEFQENLNKVSSIIVNTRTSSLNDEIAEEVLYPFVQDGIFIKEQLLEDESITLAAKDSIQNLSNPELAILSLYANAINKELSCATRATNKSLHCIGEALVGGGSVTGGVTVAFLTKVGARTALRLACSALGGMVGGAITAAMYISNHSIFRHLERSRRIFLLFIAYMKGLRYYGYAQHDRYSHAERSRSFPSFSVFTFT